MSHFLLNKKGEVATFLTFVAVVLMVVGIVAGTRLAQKGPQIVTQAANCPFDDSGWDCASQLCTGQPNEADCICINMGTRFCSPPGATLAGQECIINKWITDWGCWRNIVVPTTPAGPTLTPPPGGPEPVTMCYDKDASPLYGGCTWPDNFCAQRKCPPGNDNCDAWFKCFGQKWYGPCDEAGCRAPRTTPIPPTIPGGGGSYPNGPGDPGPGGGDTTRYYNGIYFYKGDIKGIPVPTTTIIDSDNTPAYPNVYFGLKFLESDTPVINDSAALHPLTTSKDNNGYSVYSIPKSEYSYSLAREPVAEADNIGALVSFFVYNTSVLKLFEYPTKKLNVCYPKGKTTGVRITTTPNTYITVTPTLIPNSANDLKTYFSTCSNKINDISYDYSTIPPGELPTPEPTLPKQELVPFKVQVNFTEEPLDASVAWAINITDPTFEINPNDTNDPDSGTLNPTVARIEAPNGHTTFYSGSQNAISNWSEVDRKIIFTIKGTLQKKIGNEWINQSIDCILDTSEGIYPLTIPARTVLPNDATLVTFKFVVFTSSNQCFNNDTDPHISLAGSTNEAFRYVMDEWLNGAITTEEMSGFISQLTRVPGLQMQFCDVRKGECNLQYSP